MQKIGIISKLIENLLLCLKKKWEFLKDLLFEEIKCQCGRWWMKKTKKEEKNDLLEE